MPTKTRKRGGPIPAPAQPAEPVKQPIQIIPFLERHSRLLIVALILLATIRIVSTYTVFSHTFDEPAHIACGIEWLDKGVYTWEPQHPPLARVAASIGPYLLGARSQGTPRRNTFSMWVEGLAILFDSHGTSGKSYDLTLAAARLGVLPFFWAGCLVVYWWAKRYATEAVAVAAVFLFSFLPPILAHAGLATTDMACTAFLGAAFLAACVWVDEPTIRHAILFGLASGLAIASKFSTLPYFASAAIVASVWYCAVQRPTLAGLPDFLRRRIPSLALSAAVAFLGVWAAYRFSFGKVFFANISLPFPELYAGIRDVLKHNAEGHPSYLLGTRSNHGFWYFYPVDLAVKTPLALLILSGFGLGPSLRKGSPFRGVWLALAFCAGVLAVAVFSSINIGIRHVLPLYLGLVLVAAVGAVRLLESAPATRWTGWAAALLLLWYGGSSLLSHPDYLPYFNEIAGGHPEKIVVDSDLDWGQDLKRLGARLHQLGAPEVYFVSMDLSPAAELEKNFGFPRIIGKIDALNPSPGWNAVSMTLLKQRRLDLGDQFLQYTPWPERASDPGELVGKSFHLWYFPPRSARGSPASYPENSPENGLFSAQTPFARNRAPAATIQ